MYHIEYQASLLSIVFKFLRSGVELNSDMIHWFAFSSYSSRTKGCLKLRTKTFNIMIYMKACRLAWCRSRTIKPQRRWSDFLAILNGNLKWRSSCISCRSQDWIIGGAPPLDQWRRTGRRPDGKLHTSKPSFEALRYGSRNRNSCLSGQVYKFTPRDPWASRKSTSRAHRWAFRPCQCETCSQRSKILDSGLWAIVRSCRWPFLILPERAFFAYAIVDCCLRACRQCSEAFFSPRFTYSWS